MQKNKNYEENDDNIDFNLVTDIIFSKWKIVLAIISVTICLSVFYALSLYNIYKASVTLLPQSQESEVSKFSSLANLAGIDLNTTSTSNEAFYEDVLKSDYILDKLIKIEWIISPDNKKENLANILEIEVDSNSSNSKGMLDYKLKKYLRSKAISFKVSRSNGVMTIDISLPKYPLLSTNIANWMAQELGRFNETYRQKKAKETLLTINVQLQNSKLELTSAEDNLSQFHKRNKNFSQSPELDLEYARLQREVITENSIYAELRKQYEIAKIDLQKSKETITILDNASVPVLKSGPNRSIIVILWTSFSVLIAMTYVFINYKLSQR